jgi:L-iditol 2-dehydrogenase
MCGTSKDAGRLTLAKELGAEIVVDIQKEDIKKIIEEMTEGLGADIVLECSGAPQAVDLGLEFVRKSGRYTQIGLFGKKVESYFEKIAYKEITVKGTFGSIWSSWELALKLLSSGKLITNPLISRILPLSKWQEGFNMHREKCDVKILLIPDSA